MVTVQILEDHDIIEPTDWCRPLQLMTMSGGHSDYYSFESCYSGKPENHVKWVEVREIFGEVWHGHTVREINNTGKYSVKYEFVRGEVPLSHRYGKTNRQLREDYDQYTLTTIPRGKYKDKTWAWVKDHDRGYIDWASGAGFFKTFEHFKSDYIITETQKGTQ